jgi:glucose/arabinose dehydrogenase
VRTTGDPVGLSGTIIRIDPATGEGLPTNPLAESPDPNARRIVAHGLRNPYRFTVRPGTSELWIGDVGWNEWEELNRSLGSDRQLDNFGWPCLEGEARTRGYDQLDLDICEDLYAEGGDTTLEGLTYAGSAAARELRDRAKRERYSRKASAHSDKK